ncbi:hypothetical protein [Erythrobacter sp. HL-111]|uniref:hypothetical protein n=1 Tax=Erythrobacter sp. HL-111 TaxID=1798193 RepID=UPI0006DBD3E5|nr:hypothetical protein [Erythrobacter sp. HL-111]KPP82467.1 MAG: hypothetical protein HLUCCO15_14300 [Erythrobacteraceae bacterium HL-111]SDS84569.1 hypothetical protein SAMN04515621_2351 [Erythrobacter sp. HL-111]
MRIATFALVMLLAACGSDESPASERPLARASQGDRAGGIRPPGEIAFRAAWVVQCEGVGADVREASCEADGSDAGPFSCDFALSDGGERSVHSAELRRSGDVWVLADPLDTCDAAGS